MTMSMTGYRYKAVLKDVPEDIIERSIIPGLTGQNCIVTRMQKDLEAQDRKRSALHKVAIQSRIAQIGNVAAMTATIDRLANLYGDGGSEAKKQRFAQGAMTVLSTSVAVGSAHLEEAKQKH